MSLRSNISSILKRPVRWGVTRLRNRSCRGFLAILTYHRVSDAFDPQRYAPGTWTETDRFRKHIQRVQERFQVLPLHEGLQRLKAGELKGRKVAVTFDDGDAGLLDHAIPILEELRCPATVFVNGAYLECRKLHFSYVRRYLTHSTDPRHRDLGGRIDPHVVGELRRTKDPAFYEEMRKEIEALSEGLDDLQTLFLGRDQLEALSSDLFQVGMHGLNHQRFSMLSEGAQRAAIETELGLLSSLPGFRPVLAIPFGSRGDWNDTTAALAIEYGLFVLTMLGGVNVSYHIPQDRIQVDGLDPVLAIDQATTGIR